MPSNPLRSLPSVADLLESPPLKQVVGRLSQNTVVSRVRRVFDEVVSEMRDVAGEAAIPSVTDLAERIAARLRDEMPSASREVVNATGILLDPNLGAPPLADIAIDEFARLAGSYSSAAEGDAARRLANHCGAEAGLIVASPSAALWLAVSSLAAPREIVVARSHLVETCDKTRFSDLLAASAGALREVGAANVEHLNDYRAALSERTGAILFNAAPECEATGHVERATLVDVAKLAGGSSVPVICYAGHGSLAEHPFQLPAPSARDAIVAGAEVVVLAGDGLFGGPACGLIVGRRRRVAQMEEHALARSLLADTRTRAMVDATLRLHEQSERARREIPVWQLLDAPTENLRLRAHRLAEQIGATGAVESARAVADSTYLSACRLPSEQLETWCIELAPTRESAERLAARLAEREPRVMARRTPDRVRLDLRSVLPRQDQSLVRACAALAGTQPNAASDQP